MSQTLEKHNALTVTWLNVLRDRPDEIFAVVLQDIAEADEDERRQLVRSFAALIYGPRVDPVTAASVVARTRSSEAIVLAVSQSDETELPALRQRRTDLERRFREMERLKAVEMQCAAECSEIERRISAKTDELRSLQELFHELAPSREGGAANT